MFQDTYVRTYLLWCILYAWYNGPYKEYGYVRTYVRTYISRALS